MKLGKTQLKHVSPTQTQLKPVAQPFPRPTPPAPSLLGQAARPPFAPRPAPLMAQSAARPSSPPPLYRALTHPHTGPASRLLPPGAWTPTILGPPGSRSKPPSRTARWPAPRSPLAASWARASVPSPSSRNRTPRSPPRCSPAFPWARLPRIPAGL